MIRYTIHADAHQKQMIMYTFEQFNSFTPSVLSNSIIAIIDSLSDNLANNTCMTNGNSHTNSHSHSHGHHTGNAYKEQSGKYKHNRNRSGGGGAQTSSIFTRPTETPVFKITTMEQKDGIEKTFNDIQILLNKLSAKNYHANSEKIFELVHTHQLDKNDDSLRKIGDFIFTVVSQNTFFSEIYANLFAVFIEKFGGIFQQILIDRVDTYAAAFQDYKYVDQTSNYEEYCAFNKSNDAKKATATFFNHLMNKHILTAEHIIKIIVELQNVIQNNMENPTANIIDELFEFLAIFMANTQNTLYDNHPDLIENIRAISKIAPRERKSISSRTIFKAIELLDKIQKNG